MTADGGATSPAAILTSADHVVEIRYIGRGATTSVMVTDARTGHQVILDATELESLVRGPRAELQRLLAEGSGETGARPPTPGDASAPHSAD